jgi:parallel beta-helix repeat protein
MQRIMHAAALAARTGRAGRATRAGRAARAATFVAMAAACLVAACLVAGSLASPARADAPDCTRVASPAGSDAGPGTEAAPFRTAQRLIDSLGPGDTGCLREGTYQQSVTVAHGGLPGRPVTVRGWPGERATVVGRLWVKKGADDVTFEDLWLDGRNAGNLPSPTVNAADVTFRNNDVTNRHTAICFVLGASDADNSASYGRAVRPLIERNRIHDCGKLPAANHDHGIYVEGADDARIVGNWIYDNADRGIQLYPDAQRTEIAGNVIDGNGSGIIFSGEGGYASSGTSVHGNTITRSKLRFNVESWYPDGNPKGSGNTLTGNCLWGSARTDFGSAGIDASEGGYTATANTAADPRYADSANHDFRLAPGSPCATLLGAWATGVPGPREAGAEEEPAGGTGPKAGGQEPGTGGEQPGPEPPGAEPPGGPPSVPNPATAAPAVHTESSVRGLRAGGSPGLRAGPSPRRRAARGRRGTRRPLTLSISGVSPGDRLTLSGRVRGRASRVLVQVRTAGARWRTIAAAIPHDARFAARWRVRGRSAKKGPLRLRALAPGRGASRVLSLRLRP